MLYEVITVLKAASQGGLSALNVQHNAPPDTFVGSVRFVTLVACMMMGTASLPHILMRYFTTPSVRAARVSVAWSLLFIFMLYFTAPALATFTKLQMLDPSLVITSYSIHYTKLYDRARPCRPSR